MLSVPALEVMNGASARDRTWNPQIRSLILYPIELRTLAAGQALIGSLGHQYPQPAQVTYLSRKMSNIVSGTGAGSIGS
jgi:hypothetical protein